MDLPPIRCPDLEEPTDPRELESLSLDELRELDRRIQALIRAKEQTQKNYEMFKRGIIQLTGYKDPGKTYQWRTVTCGKPNCKCQQGERHGPYLYAYWRENGSVRSEYLGKSPDNLIDIANWS